MQEKFPDMLETVLSELADNDAVDTTPWYAAKWTEAQKAATNAEFLTLMRAPAPQADHFVGLDVLPTINSDTMSDVDGCRMPSRYSEEWRSAFRGIGWSKTSADAPLLLEHSLRCDALDTINVPKYTRIWNTLSLKEPNFVFMFNGRVVRRMALIQSWNVLATADRGASGIVVDRIEQMFDQVHDQIRDLGVPAKAAAKP